LLNQSALKYRIAPTIDMDLKPIAVMLQLVRPGRPRWRLFGHDWLAWMDESGKRV
jgi:hypothetical protein